MKKKLLAGCIALAAGIGAGQASAATYGATADTGVYQFLGNMYPFGVVDTLFALHSDAGHSFNTVLDFNTLDSALSTLTAGNYTATLNLYVVPPTAELTQGFANGISPVDHPMTIDILAKNGAWTETGAITWASTLGGANLGSFTVDSLGWISVDITSIVAAWATAGSTGDGIVLNNTDQAFYRDPDTGLLPILAFNAKETDFSPYIDIQAVNDVSETPLPAALPLFATGLGALGVIAHRRKRKQAA